MPGKKIKPSSVSDSAIRFSVSFTSGRVSTFCLVSAMAEFLFLRADRHRAAGVPDLPGLCWAGECFSKHSARLQGAAGQRVLPPAPPSPQTGVSSCTFLCGDAHSSHSWRERPRLCEWEQTPHPANPCPSSCAPHAISSARSAEQEQPLTVLPLPLMLSLYPCCRAILWKSL